MISIIAAYIVADLLSGVYHYATDKGWNIRSQCEMFQEHHDTNTMQGFDWQTFAIGMPIVGVGAWWHSTFCVALGVFLAMTQVTHYYAHRKSKVELIHHIVRVLQILRIIVSPVTHQSHHKPPHGRNFCLLSGWCNTILNFFLDLFEPKFPRIL